MKSLLKIDYKGANIFHKNAKKAGFTWRTDAMVVIAKHKLRSMEIVLQFKYLSLDNYRVIIKYR